MLGLPNISLLFCAEFKETRYMYILFILQHNKFIKDDRKNWNQTRKKWHQIKAWRHEWNTILRPFIMRSEKKRYIIVRDCIKQKLIQYTTCILLVVFSGFLHQWNIVESGHKHHKPNQTQCILMAWLAQLEDQM